MKKKLLLIIFLILISIHTQNICLNTEEVKEQINEEEIGQVISKIENSNNMEIDLNEIFEGALSGNVPKNIIIKAIGKILGKELANSLKIIISILIIIIIHSILKNICENLGNEQTGKIGYFVQLIILITILTKVYAQIITQVKQTLEQISSFVYMLIPLYMSINLASGNITTATSSQAIILVSTNIITTFINQFLIPILVIATVIGIISNISDEVHMNKLSKYMKSISIWILCIFLTIFTCILTMEANLGQGVDNLTAKTGKTVVSTAIPIVGKILGDTVESVLGCANVIKNAVGALGIIAVFIIGITPIIKIGIVTIFIYLISGIAEIIADKKIVYVLEQMGDSCKVLLASIASVSMMLIIGFTITMKIGI